MSRSAAVVYATHWAADSAIARFGVDADRVHVIPFGTNLAPEEPVVRDGVTGTVRVLFVGKNWHRKGGDTAVEAVRALRDGGVDAELTVCGSVPPVEEEFVRVMPFVDRNQPGGLQRMMKLFATASILILPTHADCFGIVLCEAAAFGLPAVVSDVGGVPEVVIDDVTGTVLPVHSPPEEYAAAMHRIVTDDARYRAMARAARVRYEDRLNWPAWARAMTDVFETVRHH